MFGVNMTNHCNKIAILLVQAITLEEFCARQVVYLRKN